MVSRSRSSEGRIIFNILGTTYNGPDETEMKKLKSFEKCGDDQKRCIEMRGRCPKRGGNHGQLMSCLLFRAELVRFR